MRGGNQYLPDVAQSKTRTENVMMFRQQDYYNYVRLSLESSHCRRLHKKRRSMKGYVQGDKGHSVTDPERMQFGNKASKLGVPLSRPPTCWEPILFRMSDHGVV